MNVTAVRSIYRMHETAGENLIRVWGHMLRIGGGLMKKDVSMTRTTARIGDLLSSAAIATFRMRTATAIAPETNSRTGSSTTTATEVTTNMQTTAGTRSGKCLTS